jgi:hypothetical protein
MAQNGIRILAVNACGQRGRCGRLLWFQPLLLATVLPPRLSSHGHR